MTSPVSFFQQQRGQQGLIQPLIYAALCFAVFGVLRGMISIREISAARGIPDFQLYMNLFVSVPVGTAAYLAFEFALVGLFHLCCLMVGGKESYAGTFRAHVYSLTPFYVLMILIGMIELIGTKSPTLIGLVGLIAMVWTFSLLVYAFREIHSITESKAIGAALPVSLLLLGLLLFFSHAASASSP